MIPYCNAIIMKLTSQQEKIASMAFFTLQLMLLCFLIVLLLPVIHCKEKRRNKQREREKEKGATKNS